MVWVLFSIYNNEMKEVKTVEIKRKDDKPIVIHTKEKTKIHIKGKPETKIKGRNILTVSKAPKIAVTHVNAEISSKKKPGKGIKLSNASSGKGKKNADGINPKNDSKEQIQKEVTKEAGSAQKYVKSKNDREKAIGKKTDKGKTSNIAKSIGAAGAKIALDQMEGGNELYDSYMIVNSISRPVANATRAGRNLFYRQELQRKQQKIKKVNSAKKIRKSATKGTAEKVTKDTAQKTAKETAKEAAKSTTKAATKAAVKTGTKAAATATGTVAGSAVTGPGGVLIGMAAGEAVGMAMDKRDIKNSSRNRMIQFFVAKLRAEDNQDSIAKVVKDLVLMRFAVAMKYVVKYVGLFLLSVFGIVALIALPIIAIIAIIYNSPLAIFFPSISSAETTQEVLSAYVSEFNKEVDKELRNLRGYDKGEKVYIDFGGEGVPDNYCDILAVYMVKHGNGDTATDMTDKAKKNLKKVFNDMCSYQITSGTETETEIDEEGNTITYTYTVKYVNITLRTYQDMISVYRFNTEEQEMLKELMKPENLAMIGYSGPDGSGQAINPEQYQAIVDDISDANGKRVVEFALSKVGYPYSQVKRDSGDYFDCSSLAYYAWRKAGVSIMYSGSNTAAAEGQYCYENSYLVDFSQMRPGDLIFYSYAKNGRFKNISHVAIYVGNGMMVEAANEKVGVVYRAVHSKSSIVFIGRPR